MLLVGEVAPAAPALGALIELALLLFAFAFVWTIRRLIQALFGWMEDAVSWLPWVGGEFASLFQKAEQAVANALGAAEREIDAAIGASWHLLARYTEWLWREIRGHGVLILQTLALFDPISRAILAIRALVHHLNRTSTSSSARVKTLEREYHGIEAKVRTLEKEYHGIDQVHVRKRLGAIEKELGRIEAQTIPAIQQAENDAQSAISNLYEWAKGKASLLGAGTFATAVAAVLSAVGLDWIACRSRNSVNGKSGCNLWNDLESLLGAAIVTGLALDLPALIHEAQTVTPGIVNEFEKLAGIKS